MPMSVPPVSDEREGLLAYLAQQRDAMRATVFGLTDDQARETPTAGALSLGGLLKHVTNVERGWMDTVLQRDSGEGEDYEAGFRIRSDETLEGVLDRYAAAAAETEAVIAAIADLARPVPVPDAPWFPDDVDAWSVRWVLLHLIEETARHAGHADIIREEIDGATTGPLLAAAEGWPATDWIQPWEPPYASATASSAAPAMTSATAAA
jgi:uncharacterized damage-inducible protein DinB